MRRDCYTSPERTRVPRRFVVIGTTGSTDYLRDTGSRRFWPVRVVHFDLQHLAEIRDQLWAEAAVAEAAGGTIDLESDLFVRPNAPEGGDAARRQCAHRSDGSASAVPGWPWIAWPCGTRLTATL